MTRATRRALAAAAFAHTAAYDAAVAGMVRAAGDATTTRCRGSSGSPTRRSGTSATARTRTSAAALYREAGRPGRAGRRQVLQGKEMSFNNWLDAYAAHELVAALPEGAA